MRETKNKLFYLIIFLIAIGLIYLLKPILTPFLAGALLAYFADPFVEKMSSWRVPRIVSVILVFLGFFSLIILCMVLLVPVIENQILDFVDVLPQIISTIQNSILPWISQKFGIKELVDVATLKATLSSSWTKAGSVAGWMLKEVLHSSLAIMVWLTNLVLIPVVTFYLLRDWNQIIHNIRELLPRHIEPMTVKLAKNCDDMLGAFIRGQLIVMIALGSIYAIGLTLIGLQLGLIIGLLVGLLSIVPYLGFITGIITASIMAIVQFGTLKSLISVWIVFAIGQTMEGMVLTPALVGKRIGLHPVAVIFSVLTGGMLFGFFGVLLALPAAAVIMVLLRHLNERYRGSQFYR